MRSNIDQQDHVPQFCVYDTNSKKIEIIEIPIKPVDEVFNLDAYEFRDDVNESIKNFVNSLKNDQEIESLDYVQNLVHYMEKEGIKSQIRDIVMSTLEDK